MEFQVHIEPPPPNHDSSTLHRAILSTLAYADVFDYPLRLEEIHRYLIGFSTEIETLAGALSVGKLSFAGLCFSEGFYSLPGHESNIATRKMRTLAAARQWPKAVRYAHWIGHMPFVRMVALTGALAMQNNRAQESQDFDYFVVTAPNRVWFCRGLVMLLVRWALRQGDVICPNYFLAADSLRLQQHTLYAAHELTQMVPLSGLPTYHLLRQSNPWTADFLPNAGGPPPDLPPLEKDSNRLLPAPGAGRALRSLSEQFLGLPIWDPVERWEMQRKIRKLLRNASATYEADFTNRWCKGHFNNHEQQTMAAYQQRLAQFSLAGVWDE